MGKFIIGTFLMLGWTFYEMSGGADFEPERRVTQVAAIDAPEDYGVEVARASTASLIGVNRPVTPTPAIANNASLTDAETTAISYTVVESPAPLEETTSVEVVATEEIEEPTLDLRVVAGSRVNMRSGPGTGYRVLDTLPSGTEAEVISVDATGWANIRITSTDQEGWMAERLLSDN